MNTGFNKVAQKSDNITIDIVDLRRSLVDRLGVAYHRQDLKNNFNRSNRRTGSDDSLLGSLIFSSLTWGAFFGAMGMHFGDMGADMGHSPVIGAALDGLTLLTDEQARLRRARIYSALYPQGRRQGHDTNAAPRDKFNLVAANQNSRFTYDVEAEITCMIEMLDMLDKMAKNGVTLMSVDAKKSIYDTLTANAKQINKTSGLNNRFMMPVRKAA